MIGRKASFRCAVISEKGHSPSRAHIYKGQVIHPSSLRVGSTRPGREASPQPPPQPDLVWAYPQDPREPNPKDLEWEALVQAIQRDTEHNEVDRGLKASLVTSMGRMAAHTGQAITYDQMLNHEHELAPGLDKVTADSPAPVQLDADGDYPYPMPGVQTKREY